MKPVFSSFQKYDLVWILLLIALLAFIVLAWPEPASGAFTPSAAAQEIVPTLTPTMIPPEYLESTDQTSGIICGSVVLVLIIVGGTLGVLRRRNSASSI